MTAACPVDLSSLVETINDLPSLPAVAQQAVSTADNPKASAEDLAKIIQVDPSLTAKILRITNSAYYGLSRRIANVKEAIVVLGFVSVRSLAVAVNAMKMFRAVDSSHFRQEAFWLHSTCTALLVRKIGLACRLPDLNDAFTAGMLHDIGKIVLDQHANDAFEEMLAVQATQSSMNPSIEMQMLNTTHSEVGKKLCERWRLPSELCEAISSHHEMNNPATHSAFACLCSLADYISTVNGVRSVVNTGKPPDPSNAIRTLKLEPEILGDANNSFHNIRKEAEVLISL